MPFQEQCRRQISDNSHSHPSWYRSGVVEAPAAPARALFGASTGASQQRSPEKLNRLLASIALYSDALVALIRSASTRHLRCCSQRAIARQSRSSAGRRLSAPVTVGFQHEASQWSVHPIEAVQTVAMLMPQRGRASTMQAPPQLTPKARSAMAAASRKIDLAVNSRFAPVGKILCRRHVHSGSGAEHHRDNSRSPLSALGVLPFLPPGDLVQLKYRNSFYGSANQR
jgi:hypothetical protein